MEMIRILFAAGFAIAGATMAQADELKSEARQVPPFSAVEMRGAAKVIVTVGPAQSVVVEADPQVIDRITTDVHDNTLVIDRKGHWWQAWVDGHVTVRIAVPKLSSFALAGAGDIEISGLNGGTSAFSISGTGNMKASGALDRANIAVSGAGNVDFSGVPADAASVAVNGTGSVTVQARHELNAVVNGVGSISYDGSPEHVSTAINGVGSIHQRKP